MPETEGEYWWVSKYGVTLTSTTREGVVLTDEGGVGPGCVCKVVQL